MDAMKIAKEGGVEIDEEIELLEIELRKNPVQHSIFSAVVNFKDPKDFTSVSRQWRRKQMADEDV